jgi:hypothetical protein
MDEVVIGNAEGGNAEAIDPGFRVADLLVVGFLSVAAGGLGATEAIEHGRLAFEDLLHRALEENDAVVQWLRLGLLVGE